MWITRMETTSMCEICTIVQNRAAPVNKKDFTITKFDAQNETATQKYLSKLLSALLLFLSYSHNNASGYFDKSRAS